MKNKMKKLQKRIEQVKAFLTISKLHLANGIEYRDKNINDHIAGLEMELSVLTNTTIITELDNIWSK
jgi:hypothetical protein